MKKALSFAVALGLVAGLASAAMAEDMLSINGDARWRGVYKTNNFDVADSNADKTQKMDQRYRLNADIKINDNVKVSTRIVLADNEFGNDNGLNHYVDRAHMTINMLGGTYLIGRQDSSWGNKFAAWADQVDRLKAVYKSGDLTYGGYLEKNFEGNLSDAAKDPGSTTYVGEQDFGDGDFDTYAAFLIGTAGATKYGVLLNYLYDDTIAASEDGHSADLFFTTKAGPATILGEFVYSGGDAGDNPAGDDFFGGFVGGAVGMDALTVKGLVAYYDGNMGATGGDRSCDNDFAPSLLIGTCNETAIVEFGGTTNSTNDSTYLVGAGVDFKVNDKLTVGALIGYLMASEEMGNGTEDGTLIEYDLTAQYALAQNATYSFGIALGDVDKFSVAADDAILVIGNRIDVKW
jgi:opacity protein-like surface antigen